MRGVFSKFCVLVMDACCFMKNSFIFSQDFLSYEKRGRISVLSWVWIFWKLWHLWTFKYIKKQTGYIKSLCCTPSRFVGAYWWEIKQRPSNRLLPVIFWLRPFHLILSIYLHPYQSEKHSRISKDTISSYFLELL